MAGWLVRDVVLTRDEIDGLMAGHLVSADPPTTSIRFTEWLEAEGATLGRRYASELGHLGFEVLYFYRGVVRKYRPDYIVRLKTGDMLVLETKGQPDQQTQAKCRALEQWTHAINQHGGFGHWVAAVSTDPGDVKDILGQARSRKCECFLCWLLTPYIETAHRKGHSPSHNSKMVLSTVNLGPSEEARTSVWCAVPGLTGRLATSRRWFCLPCTLVDHREAAQPVRPSL